jgi:glycosyltransferase involved in cell wall biosynthesis
MFVPTRKIIVPLKTVLMVSTSYPANAEDWRGQFIRNLAYCLAERGDLRLRLWSPPGEFPDRAEYVASPEEAHWLVELMAAGGIAQHMRNGGLLGFIKPFQLLRMLRAFYRRESGIDVYHVNWLQNALMLPNNSVPLLATVLGTDMQLLKLPGMITLLRRVFQNRSAAICPNAQWMVPELERLFGAVASIRFVPFGVARRWFDLERRPDNPPKWLCVSRLTRAKIGMLFDWCEPLFSHGSRELHLFGPMQEQMALPKWLHYHGPVTPEQLSANWFPRACGLITLSQHAEGRPQVMLEAMASGLPIIASRIAAHEDILQHERTGWLCSDATQLPQAFEALETHSTNLAVGEQARVWAQSEIGGWDDCAGRYAKLYRDLIDSH